MLLRSTPCSSSIICVTWIGGCGWGGGGGGGDVACCQFGAEQRIKQGHTLQTKALRNLSPTLTTSSPESFEQSRERAKARMRKESSDLVGSFLVSATRK